VLITAPHLVKEIKDHKEDVDEIKITEIIEDLLGHKIKIEIRIETRVEKPLETQVQTAIRIQSLKIEMR